MSKGHSKKVSRRLVALSSAAVLGVYSAGYLKTRAAAERFLEEPVRSRPMVAIAASGDAPAAFSPLATLTPSTGLRGGSAPVPSVERQPVATPATALPAEATRASSPAASVQTVETKTAAASEPSAIATPAPSPLAALAASAPLGLAAVQQTLAVPLGLSAPPVARKYLDGTYTGWGTCRHGDIQAKVVIAEGKISSATIAQCLTRYSCSWISPLPPQVIARQSPETDFVSGATDSTNAFYYALVEALSQAKPK